ncbi:hypothetical protein NQZ68_018913 [Dissostichus eleginoides]|nr:hypothetical protein NQZ68_018913 [Dissostichus eleginoides]
MTPPTDAEDLWRSVLRQSDVDCHSAVLLSRCLYDAAMKCPLHCTCPGGNEGSSVAQAAGTTLGLRWQDSKERQRSIRWRQHWLQEMAVFALLEKQNCHSAINF